MKLSGHVMTKILKSAPVIVAKKSPPQKKTLPNDVRFIVPMPCAEPWHKQSAHFSTENICNFFHQRKNLAIEDFQAHFLMEREYPID